MIPELPPFPQGISNLPLCHIISGKTKYLKQYKDINKRTIAIPQRARIFNANLRPIMSTSI